MGAQSSEAARIFDPPTEGGSQSRGGATIGGPRGPGSHVARLRLAVAEDAPEGGTGLGTTS